MHKYIHWWLNRTITSSESKLIFDKHRDFAARPREINICNPKQNHISLRYLNCWHLHGRKDWNTLCWIGFLPVSENGLSWREADEVKHGNSLVGLSSSFSRPCLEEWKALFFFWLVFQWSDFDNLRDNELRLWDLVSCGWIWLHDTCICCNLQSLQVVCYQNVVNKECRIHCTRLYNKIAEKQTKKKKNHHQENPNSFGELMIYKLSKKSWPMI